MEPSITKQFRVALIHLLAQEGRGAQSRLARQQNLDRGYLNSVVKGRKTGSEDLRLKVADHFALTYEELLSLGRRLLAEGKGGGVGFVEAGQEEATNAAPIRNGVGPELARITETIKKAGEILRTDSRYGTALANLIETFYAALDTEQANTAFRKMVQELESRLAILEKSRTAGEDQ